MLSGWAGLNFSFISISFSWLRGEQRGDAPPTVLLADMHVPRRSLTFVPKLKNQAGGPSAPFPVRPQVSQPLPPQTCSPGPLHLLGGSSRVIAHSGIYLGPFFPHRNRTFTSCCFLGQTGSRRRYRPGQRTRGAGDHQGIVGRQPWGQARGLVCCERRSSQREKGATHRLCPRAASVAAAAQALPVCSLYI